MVGWILKIIFFVKEFIVVNKICGLKCSIVILGDKDKEDMDEDLRIVLFNVEWNGFKVGIY